MVTFQVNVFCANSLFLYHSSYSSQTLIHYLIISYIKNARGIGLTFFNPYLTQSYMRFILNELTLELAFGYLECYLVKASIFWGVVGGVLFYSLYVYTCLKQCLTHNKLNTYL